LCVCVWAKAGAGTGNGYNNFHCSKNKR
jgi:hypothetical protein